MFAVIADRLEIENCRAAGQKSRLFIGFAKGLKFFQSFIYIPVNIFQLNGGGDIQAGRQVLALQFRFRNRG